MGYKETELGGVPAKMYWRYWNTNGHGVAVVARFKDFGNFVEVKCYLGAAGPQREMDAVQATLKYGEALQENEMFAMMPYLKDEIDDLDKNYVFRD